MPFAQQHRIRRPSLIPFGVRCQISLASVVAQKAASIAAGFAVSFATSHEVKIVTGKRMPAYAMCLPGVYGARSDTSQHVRFLGNRLQASWIDAMSYLAQMIEH